MKKHILQNICLAPFGLFLRIVALLPLRILYILSDLLYPLVYYIGRYRLHIVRKNLKNASLKTNSAMNRKDQSNDDFTGIFAIISSKRSSYCTSPTMRCADACNSSMRNY